MVNKFYCVPLGFVRIYLNEDNLNIYKTNKI